jgi:NADH:ubiquinone oxidoreductase subunit 2 (subunit N)
VGMMLMVSANNFLSLFMSIETSKLNTLYTCFFF